VVATQFDQFASRRRFLIRPNCSLPWRDVVRFYLGMLMVCFSIAIAFALKGAWLILPFAGLEMLALGIALYVVARRATSWQEISINDDRIRVVDYDSRHEEERSFQRAWAQVVHEGAVIKGHPSRLSIRSHGRCVEVGRYLNEDEKRYLAQELSRAVRSHYVG
jgi:uncharacterized membrane protein